MRRTSFALVTGLVAAATVAGACGSAKDAPPAAPPDPVHGKSSPIPFTASPPSVYVAKVKSVLVGLPPTDAEVEAVRADPGALKGLIDGWMATPQYEAKILTFFELAFQQAQIGIEDLDDQTYPRKAVINRTTGPALAQNVRESFARTVIALVKEGKPLTEAMTTRRFMMTPGLMELYAFLDWWQVDDAGVLSDGFKLAYPKQSITIGTAGGPVPIEETVDPKSPNFMRWYSPDVATDAEKDPERCGMDPIVYPPSGGTLHSILVGSLDNHKAVGPGVCTHGGGSAAAPQLKQADYSRWKMVTVRRPRAGETATAFWDLATLRNANELVLEVPRVGFFSTPAFFATWQTNTSNQMRVTMNQSLIVALGAQVDGTDPTKPEATPGMDAAHASSPACVACHQTLDPTRSILSSTYSWTYHRQTEAAYAGERGQFAFQGVIRPVSSVADFGQALAEHPLFAQAWAQKLCYYANSSACQADDPEFARVVDAFKASGYAWRVLVRELLSSPIMTHAAPTKTADDVGEVVAVSRRDHLCAALDHRLGFTDVCALDAPTPQQQQQTIPRIVSGLPSDGYGRGSVAPVLPNDPTLFFRAGTENVCVAVATLVIDAAKPQAGVRQWSSASPDPAMNDFVSVVMGLPPSDPRAAPSLAVLKSHHAGALAQGVSATDALRSTFVVACLAPSAVSIGL